VDVCLGAAINLDLHLLLNLGRTTKNTIKTDARLDISSLSNINRRSRVVLCHFGAFLQHRELALGSNEVLVSLSIA
jgi:hypothetical protein